MGTQSGRVVTGMLEEGNGRQLEKFLCYGGLIKFFSVSCNIVLKYSLSTCVIFIDKIINMLI